MNDGRPNWDQLDHAKSKWIADACIHTACELSSPSDVALLGAAYLAAVIEVERLCNENLELKVEGDSTAVVAEQRRERAKQAEREVEILREENAKLRSEKAFVTAKKEAAECERLVIKKELHQLADNAEYNSNTYPESFPTAKYWAAGMREAAIRVGMRSQTLVTMMDAKSTE